MRLVARVLVFAFVVGAGLAGGAPAHGALADSLAAWAASARDTESVRFYRARNFAPAWRSAADRRLARGVLARAAEEGLNPADYRVVRDGETLEYELSLTAAVLRYARDARLGRVSPGEADRYISVPGRAFDAAAALNDALARGALASFFGALPPPHAEYRRLKAALARYRAIADAGGWSATALDARGPERAPAVAEALWHRLALEDSSMGEDFMGDAALDEAVRRYQRRNALKPDGLVGPRTLAALNMPATVRAEQIAANMERWRWLPRDFGPVYVEVNAATATLKVVEDGRVVLASRIVAGKASTPTPIFAATITAVTVNPSWNIPPSIARNELWPKERANPGYLAAQHIVVEGDSLRQRPGDDNALGRIKLEMPNRFNSYLHDTPAKGLFAHDDRHFSHGCMRVQEIAALASFALTRDTAAGLDRLAASIATGTTERISLDTPLPVYVLYWTAMAHDDGTADFAADVYGRDDRLLAALSGRRPGGRVAVARGSGWTEAVFGP